MTTRYRSVVGFLRPVARRWRKFMAAEVRNDLAEVKSTQSEILQMVRRLHDHSGLPASRPSAPLDPNVLLHQSRSALLRSMPRGADTFLSVGCSGSWYFDWIERCYGRPRKHIGIEYYVDRPPVVPDNVTWIANTAADMSEVDDGSCDLLFSGQNVEHLWPDEVVGFFIEAARVIRHGGHLVIDSPNRALTAPLNWSHPEHTIELTLEEVSQLVSLAGFNVTKTAGIWLCRDPASERLLPFDPNVEELDWSVPERLLCALDDPAHSFIWWLEALRTTRPIDMLALRTAMQDIFEAAWPERTGRMRIGVGQIENRSDGDWVVCRADQSGAVLFGPYMPLRAGRYQCTFRLDMPDRTNRSRVARCEVIVNGSDTPIAQHDVIPAKARADGDVTLDFHLQRLAFGVQFRCISYGRTEFACRRQVPLTGGA
jgi:SAM-dependent methyltransferase